MENISGKLKTYSLSVLVLTVVAAILRTVSIFTDFNEKPGFFNNSNPLNSIFVALFIITCIWIFTSLFTFKKNTLPKENKGLGYFSGFGAVFSIVACIAAVVMFVKMFIDENKLKQLTGKADIGFYIALVAAVFFLLSIAYFLLSVKAKESLNSIQTVFGTALIFALVAMLASIYFDMDVAMNNPNKTTLELTILALLLFFVADMRFLLSRALPRWYFVTALLATFISLVTTVPNMISFIFGKLNNSEYFMYSFILFAFGLYAAAKLLTYVIEACAEKKVETANVSEEQKAE